MLHQHVPRQLAPEACARQGRVAREGLCMRTFADEIGLAPRASLLLWAQVAVPDPLAKASCQRQPWGAEGCWTCTQAKRAWQGWGPVTSRT